MSVQSSRAPENALLAWSPDHAFLTNVLELQFPWEVPGLRKLKTGPCSGLCWNPGALRLSLWLDQLTPVTQRAEVTPTGPARTSN